MKDGLIRLTDENNIFFDSIEKVYRYRMHCPNCKKVIPSCRCYHDLEQLEIDIDDGIADYTCSSKCSLVCGEWDGVELAMQVVGVYKDVDELIKTLSDKQIKEFLKKEYDGCNIHINWNKRNHENLLIVLKENELEEDILNYFNISRGKSVEELTEEEAGRVMEILIEDADFDSPGGEECSI